MATPDAFYVRLHSLSKDVRFVVMKEIAALPTVGALLHDVGSNNLPQSGECAQVSPSSPMSRCASRP